MLAVLRAQGGTDGSFPLWGLLFPNDSNTRVIRRDRKWPRARPPRVSARCSEQQTHAWLVALHSPVGETLFVKDVSGFTKSLDAAMKAQMAPVFTSKEKRRLVAQMISNILFDDYPEPSIDKPSPQHRYLSKMWFGNQEILTSLDILGDIEFYVSRFPYKRTSIPKHRHLQFYVGAWLHEIYVLEKRLTNYLGFVEHAYRQKNLCSERKELVRVAFKKISDLRSVHVHETRLNFVDRLSGLDLLAHAGLVDTVLRKRYDEEYRKIRKMFTKWIKSNNTASREVVNDYFKILYVVIFNEDDGTVYYPSNLPGA